jgi:hypothetical protein
MVRLLSKLKGKHGPWLGAPDLRFAAFVRDDNGAAILAAQFELSIKLSSNRFNAFVDLSP